MSDREWPDDWPLTAIRIIEKQSDEIERLGAENERILKCIRWHRQALWNTRSIGHPYDIALYKETVEDERS